MTLQASKFKTQVRFCSKIELPVCTAPKEKQTERITSDIYIHSTVREFFWRAWKA